MTKDEEYTMENKWEMLESSNEDRERIWKKNRTFAGDVWFRFRHKPTSIAGFVIIVLLLLFALAGPLFTNYSYKEQNLEVVNVPPVMKVFDAPDGDGYFYITQALKLLKVNEDGTLGVQLKKVREESDSSMTIYDYNGKEVAVYYGVKPYVVADPETRVIYSSDKVINKSYILGTDSLGRDNLTRLMYGTRISLLVAFVAVLVNMIIGIIYGGISGYAGGMTDTVMMRIVDIIYSLPDVLIVILLSVAIKDIISTSKNELIIKLGAGMISIFIVFGLLYWVGMARQVRGQILSIKEQEYVLAARAMGASPMHIIMKHMIPNCVSVIIITAAMQIPSAIFTESYLSFLGLGVNAPMPSLGSLASDALNGINSYPYRLVIPAVVISLIVLSLNLLGDGLRDAFDPKLNG